MITLDATAIRVVIDERRGAEVVELARPGGDNVLARYEWESPLPAHRSTSTGDDELDWLSAYRGGWQETFPNAGQACRVGGVPLGFHGEASSAQWTVVDVTRSSCTLRVGCRLPLELERRMWVDDDRAVLLVESTVTNVGAVPASFCLGHHPAFPAVPGGRIELPAGATVRPDEERAGGQERHTSTWPLARMTAGDVVDLSVVPDGPVHTLHYVDGLRTGWAAVRQPGLVGSVAMAWDVEVYPYSWVWLMRDDPGYPWYGRAAMLSVECQTAWPYDGLANAMARRMAHRLEAGGRLTAWYTITLVPDGEDRHIIGVDRQGTITFEGAAS